ncbi:FliC/FljB family flagellin [Vreelandella venusta]|uniref:Flagellin n=1 Tax=Vreelandella venusta TaxID=44935 RepID=A0AAQ0CFZ6_9GAMM|nr:FliC/FljB family flagellin [Halomonas venusta]QRL02768.1 FliC/FljB family flagellin [Halomonas venusta]GEK52434.1 flagellin [Halomonas venusta]
MSVINTNITSMIGQSNLSKSQSALQTSMERLSSGLRINSAKDDAAGQAIANRMSSQITGLSQAQRNANDGISVAQTAEGALNQVNDNLQRVRELTVQAQNGTNSQKDLDSIQAEIGQRMGEINRISQQTDFNGVKVLANDQALNIQVGANDGEQIAVNLKEITSTTLGLSTYSVSGPDVAGGFTDQTGGTTVAMQAAYGDTTSVNDTSINNFSADLQTSLGLSGNGSVTIADTSGNAKVDSNGNWYAEVSITLTNDAAGQAASESLANKGLDVAADGAAKTFYVALDPQDADTSTATAAFTVDGAKLSAASLQNGSTADPLKQLDDALSMVDTLRSDLGAVQNRFESAITNLNTNETNLSAARSRIEDADYAVEVANMTKSQILQQAGTSVLAQANQIPQNVLSLLG